MSTLDFDANDPEASKDALGWNEDELEILREWRPASMGVMSSFLGKIIETDKEVLTHAHACKQWEKEQTKNAQTEKSSAYNLYLAECRLRKENINLAKNAWKDALDKRKAVIEEWDTYVNAMKSQYMLLRDSIPPRLP